MTRTSRSDLAPFRRVPTASSPLFDLQADGKQHHHLDEGNESVNGKPSEGTRLWEAHVALVEALLREPLELDAFAHDQTDGRAEDDAGPGEVAEYRLVQQPNRHRDERTRHRRNTKRNPNPEPVQLVHVARLKPSRSNRPGIARYLISFSIATRSAFASARVSRIVVVGADSVPVRAPEPTNAVINPLSLWRTGGLFPGPAPPPRPP